MPWDPIWEDVFKSNAWGQYPDLSVIRFVARNFYKVEDRSTIKILELGSGTGANLWYLAREGFDVYGIDGSESGVSRSIEKLSLEGLSASVEVGDINNLFDVYQENYFDAIIDIECLCCNTMLESINILKTANEILKPGGLLLSKTFSNQTFIGENPTIVGEMEYSHVDNGPLSGHGFVRLIDNVGIEEMYLKTFKRVSIDTVEYSLNDNTMKISEWVVVGQKTEL